MPMRMIIAVMALVAVAFATTPATASIVSEWNAIALEEVRNAKFGPPVVARALAIAHTCMYDAWAAYTPLANGTVLGGTLRRPAGEHDDAHKREAISFAAYRCLVNLFPGPVPAARLSAALAGYGYNPGNLSTDTTTAAGVGNVAAAAVIADRAADGSNQYGNYADTTGYVSVNTPLGFCLPTLPSCPPFFVEDPLRWQPLIGPPPTNTVQKFIAPHWELVRPFALTSAGQFDHLTPDPDVFKNHGWYQKNVNEVIKYSRELTPERKLIVEYWADGPASELPAGHWGIFAQFVSDRDNHTIDQDAKLFFAMHNASMDAGIVGWHVKRFHDSVRPITAIRHAKNGKIIRAWGGPGRPIENIRGETWSPYNPGSNLTPAFPAFISGHAIYSSSSARILQMFTGSDYFGFSTLIPVDFGRVERGVPAVPTTMSFETFSEAVQAASDSRLYGGIHFVDDCDVGLALGELVGLEAWNKAQPYFNGN